MASGVDSQIYFVKFKMQNAASIFLVGSQMAPQVVRPLPTPANIPRPTVLFIKLLIIQ